MGTEELFTAGSEGLVPQGDAARQAVDSLRGYAYQITAAALAWLDIGEHSRIFLEVTEDYATIADGALKAVQVKDTRGSTNVTLNTESVREAIASFVNLTHENSGIDVYLEYFTTSEIGKEKPSTNFPADEPGLLYWRTAAKTGDVAPLRKLLESDKFPRDVRDFVKDRDDNRLRSDLFRKIRWSCGKPDLVSLRKEFRDRLFVIGRERFQVPATEIISVADVLLYRVLEKSIIKASAERMLTRGDLIFTIDRATRVSVPRHVLDVFTAISTGLGAQDSFPIAVGSPVWLVDGALLPKPLRLLPRPHIEAEAEEKLRKFGCCFISGASGVGKTHVAQSVAERLNGRFVIVDFRNADSNETKSRLGAFLSRLGGLSVHLVLLEDLNCFNDPQVGMMAAQVFEALARRDTAIIVTCYNPPTSKVLIRLGLAQGCLQTCPYFEEQETGQLVSLHGGNPSVWGKLAHVSGAFGHPQLVHAFIAGMAAREWPKSEILEILSTGLSSGDIDAERDTARRAVVSTLPEEARNLLYRLSLVIGSFNRTVALDLATAPPPITQPGESLDCLIGPWVEAIGQDRYRVSPLASQFGRDMIPPQLQIGIHDAIATQLLSAKTVNVSDIDKIIVHAIAGKNESMLGAFASKLLTAKDPVISYLSENFSVFRVFPTDKPIFPENASASGLLRLVQFKVLVAAKDQEQIPACVNALRKEVDLQQPGTPREIFHLASLVTVLNALGIANYLDDWFELLQEYRAITQGNSATKYLLPKLDGQAFGGAMGVPALFAIGSAMLAKVATLERIFDKLSEIEPTERMLYFKKIGETKSDYSTLINGAWVAEERGEFDYLDAAERYRRMAIKTASWGVRRVTVQCWIARAIMFDEYANDRERALLTLDEAIAACGDDILLARARAKIYWRAQDHVRALSILREIADVVGQDNDIDRAFALREAAISAAKTEEWSQAEEWFLEGRKSALQVKVDNMKVMAIGLGIDAAVAAFHVGHIERALRLMGNALIELEGVDPKASLRSVYCHHIARHTILWLKSRIEDVPTQVDGEPIVVEPGSASNPEPPAAIADRPLGAMDIAWYMLAELDLISQTSIGYAAETQQRLMHAPIPWLEFGLRTQQLILGIDDLDGERFADLVWNYVACGVGLVRGTQAGKEEFDVLDPPRAPTPTLLLAPFEEDAKNFIESAVLAYAIGSACKHSAELIPSMQTAMVSRFGKEVVDKTILSRMDGFTKSTSSSFEETLIQNLSKFRAGAHVPPVNCCAAGVRSLQQALRSPMKRQLVSRIARWQRAEWTRIITTEAFQLYQPRLTVPVIEAALSSPKNDEHFLCGLILAVTDAVKVALPQEIRADFKLRAGATA